GAVPAGSGSVDEPPGIAAAVSLGSSPDGRGRAGYLVPVEGTSLGPEDIDYYQLRGQNGSQEFNVSTTERRFWNAEGLWSLVQLSSTKTEMRLYPAGEFDDSTGVLIGGAAAIRFVTIEKL